MTDMLKQVSLAGKYRAEAKLADAAAKEMAAHCDRRIADAIKILRGIEYALQKDSLTDGERLQSARQLVASAISGGIQ
jgi:hypothetical protein